MKQLYIRKGNSKETQDIIIIGEEQSLGSRDSAYKPNKGSVFTPLKVDKYSGAKCLTYIHATDNILLNTKRYDRDYDVHEFIKKHCRDLVKWDGETDKGRVRSREAFICKSNDTQKVCDELYRRIELEIHGNVPPKHTFLKFIGGIFLFVLNIFSVLFTGETIQKKKKRRRRR